MSFFDLECVVDVEILFIQPGDFSYLCSQLVDACSDCLVRRVQHTFSIGPNANSVLAAIHLMLATQRRDASAAIFDSA